MSKVLVGSGKRQFLKQLSICLVATATLSGVAFAAANNSVVSPITVPPDPEQASSQAERIIQRQTAYKAQLPSIAQTKIINKCTVAKQAITKLSTQDTNVYSTRLATYDQLANQLSENISKLKDQGIMNVELNTAASKYYKDVNTFLIDHSNYKAAIDDLLNIDCTKDPTGFAASLLDARKLRAQMASDSVTVKSNIQPLQTALQTVKDKLSGSGSQQ